MTDENKHGEPCEYCASGQNIFDMSRRCCMRRMRELSKHQRARAPLPDELPEPPEPEAA